MKKPNARQAKAQAPVVDLLDGKPSYSPVGIPYSPVGKSPDDVGSAGLLTVLQVIADDENASPQARTAAVRTMLEVRGVLGKHARAPGTDQAAVPLAGMSRVELEGELARLRLHIAAAERAKPQETPRF
jgi:hypothetical protein